MALAWYFEGDSRRSPESSDARPSLPSESDYTNDVSRIFISLNNTGGEDQPDGARRAGAGMGVGGGGRSRRRETDEEDRDSTQSSGTLAEYFSSLFDESFCSHSFKLVGSRIFSSGKFQEEEAINARDSELSLGKVTSSDDSLNGSSASSGSSSGMSNGGSDGKMSEGEPWGWFDEMEEAGGGSGAAGPSTTKATPPYILTESLSSQRLWRETAGQRPRQPSLERQFFEEQWAKNFSGSEVDYTAPLRVTEPPRAKKRKASTVLYRATSPFGSAVSKSFQCEHCGQITSIMVHIPKFQIVQTGSDVHAEYLIVVGLGTVTLGVWRRFSEFKRLARKLGRSSRREQFHNALCSWRCLTERQRWFRCLDRDYLILKTFLLERFLHDLVFESVSPNTVRDLLGVL